MECNKDEAARAKEIAERKFSERDYAGAKKFALKALSLFPALEGTSQLLTTLDVYISSEKKINGEKDWYGILGVVPFANEETVRKQYRKLALTLHPDKNKSLGAEGAFKLVSEAWSFLSDNVKRLAYNQNRSSKGFQHNAPNHVGSQSEAPSSNGSYNVNKNATSSVRAGNSDTQAHPTSVPPPRTESSTFWTLCNSCRTYYEYLRMYLNQTLLCPNCNDAFVAAETGPPPNAFMSSNLSSRKHPQRSSRQHPQKSSQQHSNVERNQPVNPGRTGAVSQNLQSSIPTPPVNPGRTAAVSQNLQSSIPTQPVNPGRTGAVSQNLQSSIPTPPVNPGRTGAVSQNLQSSIPTQPVNPERTGAVSQNLQSSIPTPPVIPGRTAAVSQNLQSNIPTQPVNPGRTGAVSQNLQSSIPTQPVNPGRAGAVFQNLQSSIPTQFVNPGRIGAVSQSLKSSIPTPPVNPGRTGAVFQNLQASILTQPVNPGRTGAVFQNLQSSIHTQPVNLGRTGAVFQNLQASIPTQPVNPGRTGAFSQNLQSSIPIDTSFNNRNFQWGPHSRMADFVRRDGSSSVTAANVKRQSSETRREGEGAPSIAAWERSHMHKRPAGPFSNVENPSKKIRTDDIYRSNASHTPMKDGSSSFGHFYESGKANMGTERIHGFSGIGIKPDSMKELSFSETRQMLIGKAHTEIRKKLQEWSKDKAKKTQKSAFNDKTTGPETHGSSNGNRHVGFDFIPVTFDNTGKEKSAYVTMNVPDPDFHNFDLDRTENSFAEDQVWAAYDDDDGMPRYYARIHKVVSTKPFRMRISWLNSRSNSELGPIDWVGSGFYKTCGDFRTGKHEITQSLNSFSHKVRWTKGTRGVVRIFPGKGEVWALYRNWSPDWNENTPDEVIHKYDMVEVLKDFNEEEGVLVTPLVKVDGFKTVFHRHSHDQARMIPKVEMFRFSHQVPNYFLTGEEAHNAPKGCQELDPAATPLDFIQTTAEANEASDNVGKTKEDTFQQSPEKQDTGKVECASNLVEPIC